MLEIFKRLCKPKQDGGLDSEAIKTLKKHLQEIDEKFPKINHGGCVFFANALKDKLEELGIKTKFYVISNTNMAEIIETREDNSLSAINSDGAYLYHMMCKVGDYIIDSTGIYNNLNETTWRFNTGKEVGKEEVVRNWLNERGVWNPTFNQEDLPEIYENIKAITLYNESHTTI